ncbi:MAG TPA: orotidine-5'-phosphate decarboxylase [Actinomycetota bacterium]|nr:orotidine-5'-phosphate decarboxylase [Actinomycetota bacterium]
MSRNPLIVAADLSDADAAEDLARRLAPVVGMVKVGLELFCAAGPAAVSRVARHAPVFLDLKLHDIPATVQAAARGAARLGASMLSVHALGGPEMVRAAVEGAAEGAAAVGKEPPDIAAVTVLSSLAEAAGASPASLAFEAQTAGAKGAIVSGEDVKAVREILGPDLLLVVPGIRPTGDEPNDHARVLTPAEAMEAGADYVVVGRPITRSPDPRTAAEAILREVGSEGGGGG